ncbi:MAG: hypothetical protein M3Y62_00130 [Candidatus Dormibacteraeota bacterium]|nr:hypothetical protein [Candidatus Dormibacteraeota bacterium]
MNEDTKTLQERTADTTAGVISETAKAASHPRRSARKRVTSLERSGAPTARRARRQAAQLVTGAASATTALVDGTIPSQIVLRGLGLVRSQARRHDLVGEAAYRTLQLVHDGFANAVKSFARFEAASEPPVRTRVSRAAPSTRTAAARTRRQTSTASRRAAARPTAAGTPRKRPTTSTRRAVTRVSS